MTRGALAAGAGQRQSYTKKSPTTGDFFSLPVHLGVHLLFFK